MSSADFLLSILFFWGRRRQLWFWAMVAVFTAAHLALVVYVPWPNVHGPMGGPALMPLGLVDIGIMCGCFKLVEKMMPKGGETGAAT
jgi:hypothetical protein